LGGHPRQPGKSAGAMSPLGERLKAQIALTGPISVAQYMAACLYDPRHGYYTTREPFGAAGDFTTAPEVSQMFGELVALWLLSAWHRAGRPRQCHLVEIGPGRGTLMADMLRTLARAGPDFLAAAEVRLVEISPRLREVQARTLAAAPAEPRWIDRLEELPERPCFLVANELFDAIPVRQFLRTPSGWRERMVTLGKDGELAFAVGTTGLDPAALPPGITDAPVGAIVEIAPAREALMATICGRIASQSGATLLIDYGTDRPAPADTLQALRNHAFADVLAEPGMADLTSHVDFASLARIAAGHGLAAEVTTQGAFLLSMGLLERAGSLGAARDAAMRERLSNEVERLAGEDQMGSLFKALTVFSESPPSLEGQGTD
jgi:SAM-dependent MidA family methyltransferase